MMLFNSLFCLLYTPLCVISGQHSGQPAMRDERALSSQAFIEKVTGAGGKVDFVFGLDRPFKECHASTLTQSPKGTIIVAWFAGTKEKNPDVGIWSSLYVENQWTPPQLTVKVEESAHWNPVLFTDTSGETHLFFKVGPEIDAWKTFWMTSADDGVTWSAPQELVPGDAGGRGPVKNKPILLSDGAWLAPASTELRRWESFADRSEDRGRTWHRSANFEIDRSTMRGIGAIQPTFWESSPGHVHALVRTASGFSWRADSDDYGRTWTPLKKTGIPNNNSSLDVLMMDDAKLLLVLNPVQMNWGPRTPLSLALSKDNGEHWEIIAHLEDEPPREKGEYSYPSIIRTAKGVAISYTHRRERIRCWQIPLAVIDDLSK